MLGENIKTLRQSKGYTQEELAARLHVTRQTISKWEKNYSVPDADLLVRLSEVLEVDTGALLAGAEEQKERQEDGQALYAAQLGRIAEQMAVRNRRSGRIWKTVGIVLASVAALYLLLAVLLMAGPDSRVERQEEQTAVTRKME